MSSCFGGKENTQCIRTTIMVQLNTPFLKKQKKTYVISKEQLYAFKSDCKVKFAFTQYFTCNSISNLIIIFQLDSYQDIKCDKEVNR